MANEIWRLKGRLYAPCHVQVELIGPHFAAKTPANLQLDAKVMRIFRSDGQIKAGDEIKLLVSVRRPTDELCAGQDPLAPRLDADLFAAARFVEAFVKRWPSEYRVSRDQIDIIPAISDMPYMRVPAESELDESKDSKYRPGGIDLEIL